MQQVLPHIELPFELSYETRIKSEQFLKTLEGGCTAPIGAYAKYDENNDTLEFKGVLLSIDGKERLFIDKKASVSEWKKLGFHSAQELLNNGGHQLMEKIKMQLKKE